MLAMSYVELVEGIFWPVLVLGIWAVLKRKTLSGIPQKHSEMAAVGVLLIYPFLGFAIAIGGAGMISPRCVVPVCCGFGLAAGVLGQRVFEASMRAGMALVLGLVVWVGVREWVCADILLDQRQAFFAIETALERVPGERVVVSDSAFVLPFYFYANGETQDVIAFPVDFDAIHQFEADDSGEQNLWAGRGGVFPFQIAGVDAALQGLSRVVIVGRPDGWLAKTMEQRGFNLKVIGDESSWDRVGGVMTPMAHSESRIMMATIPER